VMVAHGKKQGLERRRREGYVSAQRLITPRVT
jgi:hypothetical protein